MLLIGLVAPHVYYPIFLMRILCFALLASAFNLLLGYTGLLSFGHAAFFGAAAYITGYLVKVHGASAAVGVIAGTIVAALMGAIVGMISIRRLGIYFSMTTLALAQLLYFVLLQAPFTGGEDGIQGIPRGHLFWKLDLANDMILYYVVFALFLLCYLFIYRITHSPFGQVVRAIRENEPRAISLGYDVNRYKVLMFVLSATLAGLAGSIKAIVFTFATLTDAHWRTSGEVVLMTLLGGMGTLFGPSVGALCIVTLDTQLSDKVGPLVTVIMGVIFIVCVLTLRRGIVGEIIALYHRVVGNRQA
jgi:branched-chain amino acid transport system permease protein